MHQAIPDNTTEGVNDHSEEVINIGGLTRGNLQTMLYNRHSNVGPHNPLPPRAPIPPVCHPSPPHTHTHKSPTHPWSTNKRLLLAAPLSDKTLAPPHTVLPHAPSARETPRDHHSFNSITADISRLPDQSAPPPPIPTHPCSSWTSPWWCRDSPLRYVRHLLGAVRFAEALVNVWGAY